MNDIMVFSIFYVGWYGFCWILCEFIPTVVIQNFDKIVEAVESKKNGL